MNYYEELGLTESASAEEIRQVYKSLARLLHPDHQCEEQLRKVAQLQMMRLNEILGVLTAPAERQKYDASIHATAAPASALVASEAPRWKPIRLGPFRIRVGTIVWSASLVVAAVGFSSALLYFEHGSAGPVYHGSSPPRPLPSPAAVPVTSPIHERTALASRERRTKRIAQAGEIDSLVPAAPITAAQRRNPPQASQLSTPTAPPAGHVFDKTQAEVTRTDPTIPLVADAPGPIAPPPGPSGLNRAGSSPGPFIGTWLYSKSGPDAGTKTSSAYRPEYVEMVIKPEENGKISGKYLGRFHVPDQALSSEVSFAFEGAVAEGTTVLMWHNDDGAEGQVRLKIVSNGAVEVAWYTTRFGTAPKLASGTAVLHRD
ncbi:MAG TPA: J domain-containing protein [Bryobacteraceae bacterium]|nr:J domain-containing protein [Bryobacteraceae bacterium]